MAPRPTSQDGVGWKPEGGRTMTWFTIPKNGPMKCHHDPEPNTPIIEMDVQLPVSYSTGRMGDAPEMTIEDHVQYAESFRRKGVKFLVDHTYGYNYGQTVYREAE